MVVLGLGQENKHPSEGNNSGLSQEPNLLFSVLHDSQVGNSRENLPSGSYSERVGSFLFPTDTAQKDVNIGPYICT